MGRKYSTEKKQRKKIAQKTKGKLKRERILEVKIDDNPLNANKASDFFFVVVFIR